MVYHGEEKVQKDGFFFRAAEGGDGGGTSGRGGTRPSRKGHLDGPLVFAVRIIFWHVVSEFCGRKPADFGQKMSCHLP